MFSLDNLLIYSAQVLLVVGAATTGVHLVGPTAPRSRLAFWRAVVAACLLLPLWPARVKVATPVAPSISVETGDPRIDAATQSPTVPFSVIPWVLLVGGVARGAWLGLGVWRLRQLRRRGRAAAPEDFQALKDALAPHAELRWDDGVDQPMTFGCWRPIILLPRRLHDLSPEAQRAVVCHELLHVARQDWAWTLIEESVQTAFWFHPAMWWALGRVQLSREETVDERVVAMMGARRPYMSALMMFAEARPALVSATPYVRRRHLESRIRRLAQETLMSPARFVLTGVALASVVVASSMGVVSALPMRMSAPVSTGPAVAQARRATVGPQLKPGLTEPLNIKFTSAPLKTILGFIGTATGITVTYERGFVDLPKVNVDVKNATLEQTLDQVLTPNQLSYRVVNERTIVVGRKSRK